MKNLLNEIKKVATWQNISLLVFIVIVLILTTRNDKKEETEKPKDSSKEVYSVIETRKNDHGFRFKLNECLIKDKTEYMVVDIDDNSIYVLAKAEQFFKGPYPLTDKDLVKVGVQETDKDTSINPVSCSDLKVKYQN